MIVCVPGPATEGVNVDSETPGPMKIPPEGVPTRAAGGSDVKYEVFKPLKLVAVGERHGPRPLKRLKISWGESTRSQIPMSSMSPRKLGLILGLQLLSPTKIGKAVLTKDPAGNVMVLANCPSTYNRSSLAVTSLTATA